jgi:hypothetical protein
MKNIFPVFSLLMLMACGSSKEEVATDYDSLRFSLDTVMVDSKDEILFVAYSLSLSDFSEDLHYLYNFSMNDHSIEIIDMNSLEFVERKPFDKEGPNGVGGYVGSLQHIGNENFFISSFEAKGIYDLKGQQIKNLNKNADDFDDDFFRNTTQIFNANKSQLIGNYAEWDTGKKLFGLADTEQRTFDGRSLEKLDFLENYSTYLVSENGGKMAQAGHWTISRLLNDWVIISTNIAADFYVYGLKTDSLSFIEFDHKLFPNIKQGTFPKETSSREEFNAIQKDYQKGINFSQPIWDKKNKVYYRFSYSYPDSENENPPATVYLTILDESFKILNETEVPTLNKRPGYHFAKDGMIWMFENMDDEIGFVRLSF